VNTLEVSTVLPNQSIFFRLLHEQKNILALKMSVTEGFGPKNFDETFWRWFLALYLKEERGLGAASVGALAFACLLASTVGTPVVGSMVDIAPSPREFT